MKCATCLPAESALLTAASCLQTFDFRLLKRIDTYIARQFGLTCIFASLSFLALFVVLDLIENIDRFIDNSVDIQHISLYYLSFLPEVFLATTPIAVLLSSLYVTGRLSSSSELSAIFSAGLSLRRIMLPFAFVSLVITVFNIVNAGWILPETTAYKNTFMREFLGKNSEHLFPESRIHILESRDRILSIGKLEPNTGQAEKITLETFDGSTITQRIDAEKMNYNADLDRWIMTGTRNRTFLPDTTLYRYDPGNDTLKLSLTASSLKELHLRPEEMNIVQHYRYIEEKKDAGFSNLQTAIIELHSRIALPITSLIIILIGVPLSTRKKRSGLAIEAGISILIGFLYISLEKTIHAIGNGGMADPVLTAWLPNIIFLGVGIVLYKTSKT
ncbi:permease YjgP/YjgQ family protein [Prosthecochloris aestuarii DSM 271]|uniref:Permease YjgP/YjgQ family protein n=1 Tax=Prosthecochloris aestuarii (strain DSM 271 / SK 413) TaxID=290512 RepID=B4S451_PROA2|nr:permease YjgP/YjgQ family protein [Prosthecochloris aestuarii DSM 271]